MCVLICETGKEVTERCVTLDHAPARNHKETRCLAQDVRVQLHTYAIARLKPVLRSGLLAGTACSSSLGGFFSRMNSEWRPARGWAPVVVVGAVDLDPWFHKVDAFDAVPADNHGHHDAWIEVRSVCAEKGGAIYALHGTVHPKPEDLRVLEILACGKAGSRHQPRVYRHRRAQKMFKPRVPVVATKLSDFFFKRCCVIICHRDSCSKCVQILCDWQTRKRKTQTQLLLLWTTIISARKRLASVGHLSEVIHNFFSDTCI